MSKTSCRAIADCALAAFGVTDWKPRPRANVKSEALALSAALTPSLSMMPSFCLCSGEREEWWLSVRTLKEMEPEARAAFLRLVKHHQDRGQKKAKRRARRADAKAKALLYRYLTQEQKWTLRATKGFDVTGQDGVLYRVAGFRGVFLPGTPFGWCIHSDQKVTTLPDYDLMLAQKVLLESDIEAFMAVGHKFEKKPLGEYERTQFLDIANEDLDDPGPWAAARLAETSCG
ncbi:hypothetical protein LCGC14_2904700 [marine sediment metagenome]|uniref:Uncharacterized protein n=1 Tax=marine sediment metagenome TaxID=412755 RepID=A0A0F8YFB5_9ZZZZ